MGEPSFIAGSNFHFFWTAFKTASSRIALADFGFELVPAEFIKRHGSTDPPPAA
jgi:hypothetical protein